MRKIGFATATILTLLLLVGCGADATDNSGGGAKAKVTQLVKESIGNQYGPDAADSVKVDFTSVKEGATEGRMYLDGKAKFTVKNKEMKKTWDYSKSFQFELQHNGTEWSVRNQLFFDEERKER